jgi:uncharacterized membrane protein YhaH (DUF805 family)
MQFWGAVKFGFRNFVNFRGVVSRPVFWLWMAFVVIVQCVSYLMILGSAALVGVNEVLAYALQLFTLLPFALNIPTLALSVRRLRDSALNPWLLLILLIPYVFVVAGAVLAAVTSVGLSYGERLDALIFWQIPSAVAFVSVATLYVVAMTRPSRVHAAVKL